MKCNHCNSEWKTDDKVSSSLSTCPFCGKGLTKEEEPKSYENSKDALAAIMNKHGPDVLLGEKLKAFFSDYAPSVPQNIKKLVNAVYENGAAQVLKKNLNASQADKESAVKVAIRNLTEAFIVPDMAESIIYEFVNALGWQVSVPEPVPPPDVPKQSLQSKKDDVRGNKENNEDHIVSRVLELLARDTTGKGVSVPPNFIRIVGGTFRMGSDDGESDEKPVHTVTVSSFSMAKHPVTQREWQEVMGTTVRQQRDKRDSSLSMYGEGDNHPMYYVNWYEAVEFCNKLSRKEGLAPAYTVNGENVTWDRSAKGYRLPTEAEWEYAARGGDGSPGNFKYSGSNNIDEVAWYEGNSGKKTHPVGTKKANVLGLYDMSGNVWEWCWDWYGDYSGKAQTNPEGISSGSNRVMRGGSWGYSAQYVRSAYRFSDYPSRRDRYIGFRLVRPCD